MSEQEFTSLKISKNASKQLTLISDFSGKTKQSIIEKFILELFHEFYGEVNNAISSGAFIDFNYSISAFERADMTSGQYPIAFEAPNSESSDITWRLVESAFNRLDSKKEENKVKFKKSLADLANP